MANLDEVDAVACDDRFLNKAPFWTNPSRGVPTVCSLDLLRSLVGRQELSAAKYQQARHKLRNCGYYAVPLEPAELLAQLDRASSANGTIVETPELRAIRENVSLAKRAGVFLEEEAPWFLGVRMAFAEAFRELWQRQETVEKIAPKAEWLLAFLPDPLAWCVNPDDEQKWVLQPNRPRLSTRSYFHSFPVTTLGAMNSQNGSRRLLRSRFEPIGDGYGS